MFEPKGSETAAYNFMFDLVREALIEMEVSIKDVVSVTVRRNSCLEVLVELKSGEKRLLSKDLSARMSASDETAAEQLFTMKVTGKAYERQARS